MVGYPSDSLASCTYLLTIGRISLLIREILSDGLNVGPAYVNTIH